MKCNSLIHWVLLIALVVGLWPLAAQPARAQGDLLDFVPDDAETGLPDVRGRELDNRDAWWVIDNPDPDATTTFLRFQRVALRAGDVVTIMDGEGRVYQQFGGALTCPDDTGPCPAVSVAVPGNRLLLQLQTGGDHGLRDALRAAAVETGVAMFTGPVPPPGYRVAQVVREEMGMPIENADPAQTFNWYTTAYLYVPEDVQVGEPVNVVVDVLPLGPHADADSWTLNANVGSVDDTGSIVVAYDGRAASEPGLATWEWVYLDPATGKRIVEAVTAPGGGESNWLTRRDGGLLSAVYQALKDGVGARELLAVMFEPTADALNDLYALGLLAGDSEAPGTYTLAQADYALTELLIPPVPYLERVRFTLPLQFERATALPLQVYAKVKSLRAPGFPLGLPVYHWTAKFSVSLFAEADLPAVLPGRIVFVSDRHGNDEIYSMNADGSDVRRLTDDPANDQGPVWSPDGRRIAFHSYRDDNWEVYVMDADGGNLTRLTNIPGTDSNPKWSPDGTQLVFHSNRDGRWHLYQMDAADGNNVVQLTADEFGHDSPDWSPDGTQLAFGSDREGNWDVYVMDVDGGNLRQLTDNPGTDTSVAWSPDGTEIAFHGQRDNVWNVYAVNVADGTVRQLTDGVNNSARPAWASDGRHLVFDSNRSDGNNYEIYIMDPDGANVVRLTDDPAYDRQADWWVPSPPPDTRLGRIAFEAQAGDTWSLYTVYPDGSGLTQITTGNTNDRFPAWSPDGTQLAFVSRRDGDADLYVMDADGRNVRQLTNDDGADGYPAWSPDGTRIAFASSLRGQFALYVMDADGSNRVQLSEEDGLAPAWSPDGTRIAFVSDRAGDEDIYVMDADGSNVTRLTRGRGLDALPAWSPDGTRLLFTSDRHDGDGEIYVMDADGGNVTRLTDHPGSDAAAVWSPDGTQIAYVAGIVATGREEVFVMNVDGSGVTQVTNLNAEKFKLAWGPVSASVAPSGSGRIAFVSDRDASFEVYAMDVDGRNLTRLTNNVGIDSWPVWSPDGTRLAFHSFVDDTSGDIYVMDADGGNLTRLTNTPGEDMYPSWSPDGTQLVFRSSRGGNSGLYRMDADGRNVTRLTDGESNEGYPQWSPDGTQILFQASAEGNTEFFLLDLDSGEVTQLTDDGLVKESPQWSPDGTQVVFHALAAPGAAADIYVMNADGTGITRLTHNEEIDHYASWTSDGRILFVSHRDDNAEAYIMNADGSDQTNLTNHPRSDWYPNWQPGSGLFDGADE